MEGAGNQSGSVGFNLVVFGQALLTTPLVLAVAIPVGDIT